jgi:hypothetical protein
MYVLLPIFSSHLIASCSWRFCSFIIFLLSMNYVYFRKSFRESEHAMLVLALQNFARVVSLSSLNKLHFRYLRRFALFIILVLFCRVDVLVSHSAGSLLGFRAAAEIDRIISAARTSKNMC